MTSDAPPPLVAPSFTAAARAAWALAAMFVVHIATVLVTAPKERLEHVGGTGIAVTVGVNVFAAAGLVWLGARLRTGRNAALAFAVIAGFGVIFVLGIIGLIGLGKHFDRAPVLVAVQTAFVVAWLTAAILIARASSSR